MPNFQCKTCNKDFTIAQYIQTASEAEQGLARESFGKGKSGDLFKCDVCHEPLIKIKVEWGGSMPTYGKIASMSPNERSAVLGKRSKAHFEREGKEQKYEMLKAAMLSAKNL